MIEPLLRAGTITAVAVSAAALPNSALALTFAPIDFSNIVGAGGPPNVAVGTVLNSGTYSDGTLGILGSYQVTFEGSSPVNTAQGGRPTGDALGNLTLGTIDTRGNPIDPPKTVSIKITFTPDQGLMQLPQVRISNPMAGGTGIPLNSSEDQWTVDSTGGSLTSYASSNVGSNVNVTDLMGEDIGWTYNNTSGISALDPTMTYSFTSDGTVSMLELTHTSLNDAGNASALKIETMGVEPTPMPEPLTILGSATAIGFGAFFKKNIAKKQKSKKDDQA